MNHKNRLIQKNIAGAVHSLFILSQFAIVPAFAESQPFSLRQETLISSIPAAKVDREVRHPAPSFPAVRFLMNYLFLLRILLIRTFNLP